MQFSLFTRSAALAIVILSPAFLAAQDCVATQSRPYICQIEARVLSANGDWVGHVLDGPFRIPVGAQLEIAIRGSDQYGRPFPHDRAGFGVELEPSCSGMITVQELDGGRFSFSANSRRGRCQAWLWVPGNLNLEWSLSLEIQGVASGGYDRAQSEYIVRRLYLALLGRPVDRPSLAPGVAEIQRGNLSALIKAMISSMEFRRERRYLPAAQVLEEFYVGLLDRKPDSEGVRTFLKRLELGHYRDVIRDIIASEEFEHKMLAQTRRR